MPFAQKLKISALLGLAGFVLPGLSFADTTYSWYFGSKNSPFCQADCADETHSKTFNPVGGTSPDVVASGWASTGGSDDETLETANIEIFSGSGLGVINNKESGGSPNHAIDNQGRFDLVLFDFDGTSVALNQVMIGWNGGGTYDTDISVLAYTGDDPFTTLNGVEYDNNSEGLTGDGGWQLVGSYDVDAVDTNGDLTVNFNVNGAIESSYWIVAAYNDVFPCSPNAGACQDTSHSKAGKDHFKLKSVSGKHTPPNGEVPVPGTLLLSALGITLMVRRHRRQAI